MNTFTHFIYLILWLKNIQETIQSMRFSIVLFMLAIHGGQSLQNPEKKLIAHQRIGETNRFLSSVQWTSVGTKIAGTNSLDYFGKHSAMNGEGNRFAVGGRMYHNRGQIRVFEYVNNVWTQLGLDINGAAGVPYGDFFYRVALNKIGNRLIGGGYNGSVARVYQYTDSGWNQMGSDIEGAEVGDHFGMSVAMNSEGNRVVIGASNTGLQNAQTGQYRGRVVVYEWSEIAESWSKIGGDIDGEFYGDFLGGTVAMNSKGNIIVARGAGRNSYNGHVQVYELTTGPWVQIGETMNGENKQDVFGGSLAMSSRGDVVVIGAQGYDANGKDSSGYAQVYKFTANSTKKWTKLGQDFEGDKANDLYGGSVAINGAGDRVAVGAVEINGNGYLRVFDYVGSTWIQTGQDLLGEGVGDYFTTGLGFNTIGDRVVVGAQSSGNDEVPNSGSVQVFEYKLPTPSPTTIPTLAPTESTSVPSLVSSFQPTGKSEVSFNNQDFSINEPFVTFKDESGNFIVEVTYTVGRTVVGLAMTLYQADCSTTANVSDVISSNNEDDNLKKTISVQQSKFANSPLVELSSSDNVGKSKGSLKFCVNAEVWSSGTSVSFRKTNIKLDFDLTNNSFTVTSNDIDANKIQDTTTTVDVKYDVDAFRCLPTSFEKLVSPGPLLQNDLVAICLEPNDDSKATVDISNFQMNFVQDGSGGKYSVAKYGSGSGGPESSGILSVISRSDQRWKVVARLVTALFSGGLSFNVTGNAYLQFRGERRFLSSVNTKATRSGQSVAIDSAGVSSFGMEVKISKKIEAKKNSTNKPGVTLFVVGATLAVVIGFFLFKKLR